MFPLNQRLCAYKTLLLINQNIIFLLQIHWWAKTITFYMIYRQATTGIENIYQGMIIKSVLSEVPHTIRSQQGLKISIKWSAITDLIQPKITTITQLCARVEYMLHTISHRPINWICILKLCSFQSNCIRNSRRYCHWMQI